jgi:hypothetical protein
MQHGAPYHGYPPMQGPPRPSYYPHMPPYQQPGYPNYPYGHHMPPYQQNYHMNQPPYDPQGHAAYPPQAGPPMHPIPPVSGPLAPNAAVAVPTPSGEEEKNNGDFLFKFYL